MRNSSLKWQKRDEDSEIVIKDKWEKDGEKKEIVIRDKMNQNWEIVYENQRVGISWGNRELTVRNSERESKTCGFAPWKPGSYTWLAHSKFEKVQSLWCNSKLG